MKNILVVEQDPVLRSNFMAAFIFAGYNGQAAESIGSSVNMIKDCNNSKCPFDLVILDISDRKQFELMTAVQQMQIPVFTVMDAADKRLIIDLLNQKRTDFIEHFIESQKRVVCGGHGVSKRRIGQ